MAKKNYSNKGKSFEDKDEKAYSKGKKSGKSNNRGRNSNRSKDMEGYKEVPARTNDPSWFMFADTYLNDAANVNFSTTLGVPNTIILNNDAQGKHYMPGVCAIGLTPTIGSLHSGRPEDYSRLSNDPVNQCAASLFTFIRQKKSGRLYYDAADIMMYLYSFDQMYMYYEFLRRTYGLLRVYMYRNRYAPTTLLKAATKMKEEHFSELLSDMSGFRHIIDNLAIKMSNFAVPATLNYFRRHMYLYSNVYVDRPGEKAQMYVFRPDALYEFDPTSDENGGRLNKFTISWNSDTPILEQIEAIADRLWRNITLNEDFNIISSDILYAYGPEKLFRFGLIDPNYIIALTYDEGIMTQIHNMTILDSACVGDITQDPATGKIFQITHPITEVRDSKAVVGTPMQPYIDLPFDNPTPSDIMYATRLMAIPHTDSVDTYITCGSEVVTSCYLYSKVDEEPTWLRTVYFLHQDDTLNSNLLKWAQMMMTVNTMSKFHSAPLQYFYINEGAGDSDLQVTGECHNYTVLDYKTLAKMNNAAFMALYGLPYTVVNG